MPTAPQEDDRSGQLLFDPQDGLRGSRLSAGKIARQEFSLEDPQLFPSSISRR